MYLNLNLLENIYKFMYIFECYKNFMEYSIFVKCITTQKGYYSFRNYPIKYDYINKTQMSNNKIKKLTGFEYYSPIYKCNPFKLNKKTLEFLKSNERIK